MQAKFDSYRLEDVVGYLMKGKGKRLAAFTEQSTARELLGQTIPELQWADSVESVVGREGLPPSVDLTDLGAVRQQLDNTFKLEQSDTSEPSADSSPEQTEAQTRPEEIEAGTPSDEEAATPSVSSDTEEQKVEETLQAEELEELPFTSSQEAAQPGALPVEQPALSAEPDATPTTPEPVARFELQHSAAHRLLSEKRVVRFLNESTIAPHLAGEGDFHLRIENEPYLPLVVEAHDMGDHKDVYLTHYREQNGDLIRDGEMVFKLGENGHLSFEEVAVQSTRGGELRDYDKSFAAIFAQNIVEQGFAEAAKEQLAQLDKVTSPRQEASEQADTESLKQHDSLEESAPAVNAAAPGTSYELQPLDQHQLPCEQQAVQFLKESGIAPELTGDRDFHIEIKNEPFIPLTVAATDVGDHKEVTLTHYVTEAGNLSHDGELVFNLSPGGHLLFEETAKPDVGIRSEVRSEDQDFATSFIQNLSERGFTEAAKEQMDRQEFRSIGPAIPEPPAVDTEVVDSSTQLEEGTVGAQDEPDLSSSTDELLGQPLEDLDYTEQLIEEYDGDGGAIINAILDSEMQMPSELDGDELEESEELDDELEAETPQLESENEYSSDLIAQAESAESTSSNDAPLEQPLSELPSKPDNSPAVTRPEKHRIKRQAERKISQFIHSANLAHKLMEPGPFHLDVKNSPHLPLEIETRGTVHDGPPMNGKELWLTQWDSDSMSDRSIDRSMHFVIREHGLVSFYDITTRNGATGEETCDYDREAALVFATDILEQGFAEAAAEQFARQEELFNQQESEEPDDHDALTEPYLSPQEESRLDRHQEQEEVETPQLESEGESQSDHTAQDDSSDVSEESTDNQADSRLGDHTTTDEPSPAIEKPETSTPQPYVVISESNPAPPVEFSSTVRSQDSETATPSPEVLALEAETPAPQPYVVISESATVPPVEIPSPHRDEPTSEAATPPAVAPDQSEAKPEEASLRSPRQQKEAAPTEPAAATQTAPASAEPTPRKQNLFSRASRLLRSALEKAAAPSAAEVRQQRKADESQEAEGENQQPIEPDTEVEQAQPPVTSDEPIGTEQTADQSAEYPPFTVENQPEPHSTNKVEKVQKVEKAEAQKVDSEVPLSADTQPATATPVSIEPAVQTELSLFITVQSAAVSTTTESVAARSTEAQTVQQSAALANSSTSTTVETISSAELESAIKSSIYMEDADTFPQLEAIQAAHPNQSEVEISLALKEKANANRAAAAQKFRRVLAEDIVPMAQKLLHTAEQAKLTTSHGSTTTFKGRNYTVAKKENDGTQEIKVRCHKTQGYIYAVNGKIERADNVVPKDRDVISKAASKTPRQLQQAFRKQKKAKDNGLSQ
ncbi:MAG: hypothetical protein WBF90_36795 [Rivularia sp. (in: cyanobacteria)]